MNMVRLELQRKERRHKLQIYYEILSAIREESMNAGEVRPTRIQHLSNMSYDKLSRYLNELEEKKMVIKNNTLSLTDKGHEFLKEYQRMQDLIERMGLE